MENCILIILRVRFQPVENIRKIIQKLVLDKLLSTLRVYGSNVKIKISVKEKKIVAHHTMSKGVAIIYSLS